MSVRTQHLIETRFSVSVGPRSAFHSSAWLHERVGLLRRFCLASLAAQTCQDFTWLLFCEESTDPAVIEELRAHERDLPFMRIELTSPERSMLTAARAAVDPGTDVLITTRLDSDDAISDRYVESVQAYADAFRRSALPSLLVNFSRGYRLDFKSKALYQAEMPNSMFHSLLERPQRAPVETVQSSGHAALHQRHVTHQDVSRAAWLIVVHGGNLVNRIVQPLPPAPYDGTVPGFTLGAEPSAP